jgi:hypothetical protein
MNNEFIDGIWFAVQHIVVVRDMPAIAIGIIKESNLSIDDCKFFTTMLLHIIAKYIRIIVA